MSAFITNVELGLAFDGAGDGGVHDGIRFGVLGRHWSRRHLVDDIVLGHRDALLVVLEGGGRGLGAAAADHAVALARQHVRPGCDGGDGRAGGLRLERRDDRRVMLQRGAVVQRQRRRRRRQLRLRLRALLHLDADRGRRPVVAHQMQRLRLRRVLLRPLLLHVVAL